MWYLLVCLFVSVQYGEGSLGDQLAETMQLCCYQGTTYARNHSILDCSSAVAPDVPPNLRSVCIFAMDQCCKEYFIKKEDCETGIDAAMTSKTCSSLTVDAAKLCCRQCSTGRSLGGSRNGQRACEVKSYGKSAEEFLASGALVTCCKNASTINKINDHSDTVTKRNQDNEVIASVCEEYAPNELCAHHCIPVPGSYKCECNPGFMLMSDGKNCKEVTNNRCKPRNPCHHKCIDNGIEVKCSCRRGYQLMADAKTCEDINECEQDPPACIANTQCLNILGSYKCIPIKKQQNQDKGQCPPGFARNLLNNACDDINECTLPKPPCPSYTCENTVGGYKCGGKSGDPRNLNNKRPLEDRCPPGFRSSLDQECEDIDECTLLQDDCNKLSQFCVNTRGSFYCQDKGSKHCPPGFKTNSVTNKCEDINECEDGEDICKPNQICVNVPGEYDCKDKRVSNKATCPEGMRLNPTINSCQDIDECVEGTHLCDLYQKCLNTNGSHECHCIPGFELDPTTGACVDINECATDQNNCIPESQRCDNTVGSFLCIRFISCGTGYILHHSSSTCEDIDECALGSDNCNRAGPDYHCVNIPGSFRCQRRVRTTTPEYDDYYYVDEEIEDDDKTLNKTDIPSASSTTPEPITLPTNKATIKPTSKLTTTASPETTVNIPMLPEIPSLPNLEREKNITENNLDNNIDLEKQETASEPSHEEEYKPLKPDKPDTRIDIEEPIVPKKAYETTEPITMPVPTEERENIPEYPKVTETTYSPIPENPTSPKLVNVQVSKDHETATIKDEKHKDGPILVNNNSFEDRWDNINPTDCQFGFEMDQYGACFDIDECAINRHTCSGLTETCRNTMGGYVCDCVFGFRRDIFSGSCTLITTSSSSTSTTFTTSTTTSTSTTSTTTPAPTTSSTTIAPTTSSTTKRYFFGYPEYPTASIRPFRAGSSCDVGYIFNFKTQICEDINECINGQATCGSAEICLNTNGGYRCECPPNMRIDIHKQRCVFVFNQGEFPPGYGNEPVYTPVDPNDVSSQNSEGEKQLIKPDITQKSELDFKCPFGTRLNIYNTCEDIDECATGEAQCGPLQVCTNLHQGYSCSCQSGYRLVGDHQCQDVDECAITANQSICSQHADCVNTVGSYKCLCHKGFRSAPFNDKVCVDVDECAESRSGALCQQRCNNVWGSYTCSCYRGYRLNPDNRTCSDVDECTEFKNRNLCVGKCLNEPGSYRCICPSGYRLSEDKRSCIDIDECETGIASCAPGRSKGQSDVCLNTRGGYRCHRVTCPQGYQIENGHRCTKIMTYCAPTDWECSHQPSTYSYNFMTFVSNLYIPESKVDLFTMRGPPWKYAKMRFLLGLVKVDAPPSVKVKADINSFLLIQTSNQAVIALVKPLEGPQSIELDLSMELFSGDQFGGIAVAKKKEDCETGIDAAMTSKTCSSLTVDAAKLCCRQCSTGRSLGGSRNGQRVCEVKSYGKSAEEFLASEALVTCCKNASTINKINDHSDTVTKRNQDNEVIASVCEEYAPNELCAHHCIPVPGSYKCECNPGFMLMSDGKNCKEVTNNRCKPRNPCHHKCIDNGIEVKCSCRRGYQLMADAKTCEDINECEQDPPACIANTQCLNILGSYKCIPIKKQQNQDKGQCPPGFARNLLNNACDDINECILPKPPCPSYTCENTVGGYKCGGKSGDPRNLNNKRPLEDRCPPGFRSSLDQECEDIDECNILQDDCNKLSQFCVNTRGSFYCQDKGSKHCPPGFKTNSVTNKCEDINECEDGEDICKPNQICVNVPGEYDCKDKRVSNKATCPEGMRLNPTTNSCQDIDECVEGTHLCDLYQKCLNTNGSHECHCIPGFELDPTTGACVDINECATDQNNCIPESQRCDNTVGSFLCIRFISCGTGYILHHSSSTCEDIDECALGSDNCNRAGPDYHCVNIPGSFRCQRRMRTTTPEYDDYYYVDEEIEDDDKTLNKTDIPSTSSTTPEPITLPTNKATIKPTSKLTTTASPETTVNIPMLPEIPSLPNLEREKNITENNLDNHIDLEKQETASEPSHEEEYKPLKPDKPDTRIDIEEPIVPKKAYETTEPITMPVPTEERENIPEYPKVSETTYSPIPENPTSPKLVNVQVSKDHETATIKDEKHKDGPILVNNNSFEDRWDNINPTDCQFGFEMDQYGACFDIDECAINRHTCSGLTETCRNTMGGYVCDCVFGFRRDIFSGSCTLIATSSSSTSTTSTTSTTTSTSTTSTTTPAPTTSSTTIAPTTSSTTKRYFFGYPEYPTASIRPFRAGSSCDVGYIFNFKTQICEDINECINGQATCGSAEICLNTNGGYRCECPPNMRIDIHKQRCVFVFNQGEFPPGYGNEPVYTPVDPNDVISQNREGEKQLTKPDITQKSEPDFKCPFGTRLNIYNTCEDIDECATGEAQCGPLQVCTNLHQGYSCSCQSGYRLVGDHQCQDVDECAITANQSICSQHADCINTVGSYKCLCHKGFRSAPFNDKVCVDVDECAESRSGALCQQRCNNVWGSYTCSCYRGYRLNPDNRTCSDVDECTEFKNRNLCVGKCLNEPGSYRCICPSGYRLSEDKRSCIDIDECETGIASCAPGRSKGQSDVCLNTRGGYRCHRVTCPQGYQIENGHRCTKIMTYCAPTDWECSHQPSTYSYNFMTFVSNLYIPESKVDLFTMRGPPWKYAKMRFLLGLVKVDAPPSVKVKADINSFLLIQTSNQAVIALVKPLEGPQSIELDLSMELFSGDQFGGIAVAKLFIYVSEYEF